MSFIFKAQKALHKHEEVQKKRTKVAEDTFAIFEKYDGWYGYRQFGTGFGTPYIISRANRPIPALHHLSKSINEAEQKVDLPNGYPIFEILVEGVPEFKDLNGLLNRSKGDCEARGAYLMVHDFIPHDNPAMPFCDRYELAKRYVSLLQHNKVKLAPILKIGSVVDLQAVAEEIWDRDGEGTVGKNIRAGFEAGKRNKNILKVKEEVTLDLQVVALEEGQGKYEGTLGKLRVRSKDGVENAVSGMTDEERDLWWSRPDLIINKVVEVKAMKKLANGSLREGRFKAVRHDKAIAEID